AYAWLGEFELLKSSQWEVLMEPWVSKANREVAGKYFKIVRVHEEIEHLNVEISCLQQWVNDEDTHLLNTAALLEIRHLHDKCVRMKNVHCACIQVIYVMLGFSGVCVEGSNDANARVVINELQSTTPIEVDEDDLLCDKAASLEPCIS
ncbi:hypothetical protein F4604DRAFT_1583657, partial [Suillus subluteus]